MKPTLTITDLPINGKKVLMRVDFNVPIKGGKVVDETRILAAVPSIKYVLERGGALILMSHLGRPAGVDLSLSLKPVAEKLSEILEKPVLWAGSLEDGEEKGQHLKPGEILMLENLRFNPAEEKPEKDPSFAKALARLGDLYVNDAFGAAHRAHSSITEVAKEFPNLSAAGLLLEKEIKFLGFILEQPNRPFAALIGGSKISSKIGVLNALSDKVDSLLIGGAMAFTFMKAKGLEIGGSLYDEEHLETAKKIMDTYKHKNIPLHLPVDFICADSPEAASGEAFETIPSTKLGLDIGPKTIELFKRELSKAKTILWNGPMGVFENPAFAKGTYEIATFLSAVSATTIVGGGDSVAAINETGLSDKFTHLSTGGGASLEFIELGTLPGIEALTRR